MTKCKICGKDLKNPLSSTHIKSKYHQKAIKQKENEVLSIITTDKSVKKDQIAASYTKHPTQTLRTSTLPSISPKSRQFSSTRKVSPSSGIPKIEKRIQNLESQVKYLMNKVSVLETKLAKPIHSHETIDQKAISKIILKILILQ